MTRSRSRRPWSVITSYSIHYTKLYEKLKYNVLRDFQPLAQIANNQMVLAAAPSLPLKSVREVIDYAKKNPGKLFNGSSGRITSYNVCYTKLLRETRYRGQSHEDLAIS